MKKIYADTSVIGGCFDIECRKHSLELFEVFKNGSTKVIISDLTMLELAPAKKAIKHKINEVPAVSVIQARSNEKAYALAAAYIKAGAFTNKHYHDALHIALATVFNADALVSWQVNVDTTLIINAINMLMGYNKIDIQTPTLTLKMIHHETGKKVQCN